MRNWIEWTNSELEYLRYHYKKQPIALTAKMLKRSRCSVMHKARLLGLQEPLKWSPEKVARFKEIYPTTLNVYIAEEFGITKGCVKKRAQMLGIKKAPNFREMTKRSFSNLVKAGIAANDCGNNPSRFQPGNTRGQRFQKGRTRPPEERAKTSATMKELWRRDKIRYAAGLKTISNYPCFKK